MRDSAKTVILNWFGPPHLNSFEPVYRPFEPRTAYSDWCRSA